MRGRSRVGAVLATGALLFGVACDRGDAKPKAVPVASAGPIATASAGGPLVLTPGGIRWMTAPEPVTDVATMVRDAIAKERAEGRTLLVYVGATWCEPCQRFHHAVERGELDGAFPRLSILAFDTDKSGEALAAAGYFSRLIPLFALPNADGRASGKQIEGSVKGEAAAGEIAPRLRELVSGP